MGKEIRSAYGEALLKYGSEIENVVVLDADVSGSTKSGIFGKANPDRFYNCGISESAMVGMAGGMAINGKIPFVNTFAIFLSTIGLIGSRMLLSYSELNIKLVGAYGGLSDSYDGASHQSLEDIAVMKTLPNVTVMIASDEVIADWMVKEAIAIPGPMYLRMSRAATKTNHSKDYKFEIGKGVTLREGSDATIFAIGLMVEKAMTAAELLEKDGINVTVVDMFTVKPIDSNLITDLGKKTGAVITAEEHSIIGGLGSSVSDVLTNHNLVVPMAKVGTKDIHGCSGDFNALFEKYELNEYSIIEAVKKTIKLK